MFGDPSFSGQNILNLVSNTAVQSIQMNVNLGLQSQEKLMGQRNQIKLDNSKKIEIYL